MKTLNRFLICFFVTFASLEVSSAGTNSFHDIPQRLASLTNKVHEVAPSTSFSLTNDHVLILQGKTKHYELPAKNMKGKLPKKLRTINGEGPDVEGFMLRVRWRKGKYDEALLRGPSLSFDKARAARQHDYFYTTAVMEFPESDFYMVVDLEFGENADTKLAARVFDLIRKELVKMDKE